jgi:16S rRNA (cytosine967-C5)-methyltransferase
MCLQENPSAEPELMQSQKDSKALAVRIHKTLAAGVIENLMQVLLQGRYADKVLAFQFKAQKKWGARDRAWVADQTYGLLRYLRRYSHYLEAPPATASDFWVLLAMHLHRQGVPLPAWSEVGHAGPYLQKMEQAGEEPRAVRESVPDWLDALAYGQMGAQWEPTLRALNVQAPVVLRTNILKTTRTKLIAALQGEGIVAQPLGDHALVLDHRTNVWKTKAFQSGWFEMQDYNSQQVASYLEVEPGMRIVDACAGAGGKTLQLAMLSQGKGQIIAMDPEERKLEILRQRARRAGVTNIDTRPISSAKTIKRLHGTADRLLLDVPCSGLGVLRRNPDARWKLTEEEVQKLMDIQHDILSRYADILKPGGLLVYATCSILPAENENQVSRFLNENTRYQLVRQQTLLPQHTGFDGFFMAQLRRLS